MRTLPAGFTAELTKPDRAPVQLLQFQFATGTVYVSDRAITFGGHAYQPLVESWGTLEDTSETQNIIEGVNTGTRQMTVTLFNTGTDPFSTRFHTENPENIKARLYQYFEGMAAGDVVLVDEFVIQDPIEYEEAGYLLSLDLVSVNQSSDPYIGQLSDEDNNFYPVVIGSVSRATGSQYGSRPVAELAGDITAAAGTVPCASSPVSAGFATSGYIVIDYEVIQYTGISGNNFTGCTRGRYEGSWSPAFPHADGQQVFKYNHEYLYSFGQGPLDIMGPVYVDGVVYTGQHTIYKDRNPVQVGFLHGDPFTMTSGSISAEKTEAMHKTSSSVTPTEYCSNERWWNENYFTDALPGQYMQLEHTEYADGPAPPGTPKADYWSITNGWSPALRTYAELTDLQVRVTGKFQSVANDHDVYHYAGRTGGGGWHGLYVASGSDTTYNATIDILSAGWDDVVGGGIEHYMCVYPDKADSGHNCNSGVAFVDYARLEATYVPYEKDFSTDIACDLSSGSGNTNPADAIRQVLGVMGIGGAVDDSSFNTCKSWFTSNNFEFAGLVAGDLRCRDVLAEMCRQSRSRLVYNGGVIKLVVRDISPTVVKKFTPDERRLKSVSVLRQSVQDIYNKITVRYAVDTTGEYGASVKVQDNDSISKYGLQEVVWDFDLVSSGSMASAMANYYLLNLATPYTYLTFEAYLAAFPIEMEDRVSIYTEFAGLHLFTGTAARASRTFGSGKLEQPNYISVTLFGRPATGVQELDLAETTPVGDGFADATQYLELDDIATVNEDVEDALVTEDESGYGRGGYGQGGYGA